MSFWEDTPARRGAGILDGIQNGTGVYVSWSSTREDFLLIYQGTEGSYAVFTSRDNNSQGIIRIDIRDIVYVRIP